MLIMVDVDLGIKILATIILAIWEKLLMVMGEVDIGTRPDTLPPITQMIMVYCCIYLLIIVVTMIVFINIQCVIVGVIMEEVGVGLKRSSTSPFTMMDIALMVTGEVDIVLIPDSLPPIIQLGLLYHFFSIHGHDIIGHRS